MATMPNAEAYSLQEYLSASFEYDCDYVDGRFEERNGGEQPHSLVQSMLATLFIANRAAWGVRSLTGQRVRVSPTRIRVVDVCLVDRARPLERYVSRPPILCAEILSPEDRFSRTLERVREYIAMGVPNVWIIDPLTRDIWTVTPSGDAILSSANDLIVHGTPASIRVADIFAEIDEAPQG